MSSSKGTTLLSCHGRFCTSTDIDGSLALPTADNCSDLTNFVSNLFDPSFQTIMRACCTIQCDNKKVNTDPFLALQCQGASRTAAVMIWIGTVVVVVFGFLHLLGRLCERGTRKFSAIGALALHAASTYIVLLFSTELVDTILYPIVAAMDIAIFCYFFSGFQYGIGLVYEAGPMVLLSFSALPLYRIITFPENVYATPDRSVGVARAEAISMLCLTILWVLHSAIYRTITYRSLWIQAWKNQTSRDSTELLEINEGFGQQSDNSQIRSRKHHMSRLWFLAAAQGHPTWHTTVGQSVGFLNVILAWRIVRECNEFLSTTCRDDYVLFQIMLYVPPVLLTLAVVSTNIELLRFALVDIAETTQGSQVSQEYNFANSLKKSLTLRNRPSADCVIEATLAYKLGRSNLYVEPQLKLFESKFDRYVGHIVCKLHFGLLLLFYIPNVIIMTIHQCLLWIWITINTCIRHGLASKLDIGPKAKFSQWLKREKPSEKEKRRAYDILVRYCGVDGVPARETKNLAENETTIRDILREHQKHINLPLILDETGPSALLYLLILLDEVLEL